MIGDLDLHHTLDHSQMTEIKRNIEIETQTETRIKIVIVGSVDIDQNLETDIRIRDVKMAEVIQTNPELIPDQTHLEVQIISPILDLKRS
jgi:hypothetical protein